MTEHDELVEKVARALARKAKASEMGDAGFIAEHVDDYVTICWRDHIDRAEAAIAAMGDGWQDIASAPKGPGQLILGHSEQRWIRFGRYYPEFRKWYYSGTNERQQYSETEGGVPTHWRALPPPPGAKP